MKRDTRATAKNRARRSAITLRIALVPAIAAVGSLPATSLAQVTYDASLGLPAQQCLGTFVGGEQPTGPAAPRIVNGSLCMGPTPGNCQLGFYRNDFPISFDAGASFGLEIDITSSGYDTTPSDGWIRAGYTTWVQDVAGHAYQLYLGRSRVCFANTYYGTVGAQGVVELTFDTSGPHLYEISAQAGVATLSIDGGAMRSTITGYGPSYGASDHGSWAWGDDNGHPWATSQTCLARAWCTGTVPPCCGSADFDQDGDVGTDADITAFFACLAGNCCASCGSADFNGDGDIGTDADIEAFFRVLAGGSC